VPDIKIDREQVRQVIMNLIINAVQAMQDGGKIEYEIGIRKIEMTDYVFLSVRDTGAGMEPSIINKIYDPFFTTKADGTGLGLAISRNIMHAHNGFIEARSDLGKGSIFSIYFPIEV
jgi:two-component system NtrC family sensor kinase